MDRGWWHHGQGVVAPWTRGGGTMDEGWWHLQTRHDGRMDRGGGTYRQEVVAQRAGSVGTIEKWAANGRLRTVPPCHGHRSI